AVNLLCIARNALKISNCFGYNASRLDSRARKASYRDFTTETIGISMVTFIASDPLIPQLCDGKLAEPADPPERAREVQFHQNLMAAKQIGLTIPMGWRELARLHENNF